MTLPAPLTGVYSGTDGFVIYRGSKVVEQVTDPTTAMKLAAGFLIFPPLIDGEVIHDTWRRILWAQCLLKVAAETKEL
jgi:hypothetical protein